MASLSAADMRFLDHVLQMQAGYCLNFSDRTFAQFFFEALNVDIDDDRFRVEGDSKGKRMRYFLRSQPDHVVARLLRALWEYRVDLKLSGYRADDPEGVEARFNGIVDRLGSAGGMATDAIDRFTADPTLEELVASIQRDVDAGAPETALDRLHTYCMKKFAHLLEKRDPSVKPAATLNARAGQYLGEARKSAKTHHPVSFKIMTSAVEAFELFNDVRNNHSLAHDNSLIERAEARFIFDAVANFLRFIKATEGQAFGP
ncbi:abortive infection family protein [Phenylobacterium sp.]|jgi:hypothetical protein|uniref:abortive infection family protein n=1 Tax=Phenylobacterium sp. TaxID=1871053 RepID=UPI0037830AAD